MTTNFIPSSDKIQNKLSGVKMCKKKKKSRHGKHCERCKENKVLWNIPRKEIMEVETSFLLSVIASVCRIMYTVHDKIFLNE